MNKINFINYVIKVTIILILGYFYVSGSLTLNRIMLFLIVFLLIYTYSRIRFLINYIFDENEVYIQDHKEFFYKILYVLLEIHRGINPLIVFLAYTDKGLYNINRYITGTRLARYNFVIYVVIKYYVMFGLMKLLIYKYYNLGYKLYFLNILQILFKRMYGLVLSILIFTDLLNNVISVLSQYNVGIYVLVYYALSTICIIGELFYFYIFLYISEIKKPKYKKLVYITILFHKNFQDYTKMNIILILRCKFTGLGHVTTALARLLIPNESNFKEDILHITKVREGTFFMSGRILYYKPVENRISFKYFDYLGGYLDFGFFDPTFEFYGESFKSHLLYWDYFKPIREIKHKPSLFLYKNLIKLAKLLYVYNQPINRFMNGKYFEMKYKENFNIFDEKEKLIVNKNLKYFNAVDNLRAKLMFFIIGDIEYYYNNNVKDYYGNYGIIQYDAMFEVLIFMKNARFGNYLLFKNYELTDHLLFNNQKKLKFYDPEENMEFLNRLFNVLGILQLKENLSESQFKELPYYVSKKFTNYNEKYVELLSIMYTYDFKRGEENQCACKYVSVYEIVIAYKTDEYFNNLRVEGENSIKTEKLEERNGRLLKSLEDLM